MALQASVGSRSFEYLGMALPDPHPALSLEEVKAHWSSVYPELTTASIEGPKASPNGLAYQFVKAVRDKG